MQKVVGSFDYEESTRTKLSIELDRFHPWLSTIYVENRGLIEFPGDKHLTFNSEDGSVFSLRIPKTWKSDKKVGVKFLPDKIVLPRKDGLYFRTGAVKNLLYFPNEFHLLGLAFKKLEVPRDKRISNSFEYYFQVDNIPRNRTSIDNLEGKILFCLSVLTCSYIWLAEKSTEENVELVFKETKSSTIPYMGSGNLQLPITISELEYLCQYIKWENLYNFHLHYSNFVTTPNYVFQLFRGCAILDYIISLFKRNFKIPGKDHKSIELIKIIEILKLDSKYRDFFYGMFPDLPKTGKTSNRLEFYELRDDHIHRGRTFTKQEEVWQFHRCVVSLNEVIRILIPHLYKIKDWNFTQKDTYNSLSSEEIVDLRESIIPWRM